MGFSAAAGTIAEQDVQTALQQLGGSKGQLWVEHTVKYWCRHAHVQIHAAQEAAAVGHSVVLVCLVVWWLTEWLQLAD